MTSTPERESQRRTGGRLSAAERALLVVAVLLLAWVGADVARRWKTRIAHPRRAQAGRPWPSPHARPVVRGSGHGPSGARPTGSGAARRPPLPDDPTRRQPTTFTAPSSAAASPAADATFPTQGDAVPEGGELRIPSWSDVEREGGSSDPPR